MLMTSRRPRRAGPDPGTEPSRPERIGQAVHEKRAGVPGSGDADLEADGRGG